MLGIENTGVVTVAAQTVTHVPRWEGVAAILVGVYVIWYSRLIAPWRHTEYGKKMRSNFIFRINPATPLIVWIMAIVGPLASALFIVYGVFVLITGKSG